MLRFWKLAGHPQLNSDQTFKYFGGNDIVMALIVHAETEKVARMFAYLTALTRSLDPDNIDIWLDPRLTTCEDITDSPATGVILVDFKES